MNSIKKSFIGFVCILLTALTLLQPVAAAETTGAKNKEPGDPLTSLTDGSVNSRRIAGTDLDAEEAALRLYYLNMISGTGVNANGGVDFALDRGLSRLEAVIFAVRLMGADQEAEEAAYAHPYSDVPEWASAYVGYLYNRGALVFTGDRAFRPNGAATCDEFMGYVLYALGYRISDRDYTRLTAAALARKAGICTTGSNDVLTRGGACLAMYNALCSTMKNSTKVLSNKLVKKGRISYEEAIFLLWSENKAETETFMSTVGYSKQWIVPDGYYTITAADSGKRLTVSADGLTGAEATSDITQSFRLARTERGTYLIYAAESKNGYGDVLGVSPEDSTKVGLYPATSKNASEYYIEGSAEGTWTIRSAKQGKPVLDCVDGIGSIRHASAESSREQRWILRRNGITTDSGEEMAIFCCDSLSVTQGAFDTYSHENQNALDIQPVNGVAYAPFHATIVAIAPGDLTCNAVWIQSVAPVKYADGSYDYMTVCMMHDDDISDLYVGMGLMQGDVFYHSGVKGISSGAHIHLAVYRGKYNTGMRVGHGDVNAENAFFLPDNTYIRFDFGLNWIPVSAAK